MLSVYTARDDRCQRTDRQDRYCFHLPCSQRTRVFIESSAIRSKSQPRPCVVSGKFSANKADRCESRLHWLSGSRDEVFSVSIGNFSANNERGPLYPHPPSRKRPASILKRNKSTLPLSKPPTNSNPNPESSLLPCRLLPILRTTALHTDRSPVEIRAS